MVIHDRPDDFHTQPSGASGEKIACGEIVAEDEDRLKKMLSVKFIESLADSIFDCAVLKELVFNMEYLYSTISLKVEKKEG